MIYLLLIFASTVTYINAFHNSFIPRIRNIAVLYEKVGKLEEYMSIKVKMGPTTRVRGTIRLKEGK